MKNEIHKIKTLEIRKTKIRENRNRKWKTEIKKEIGNQKRNEENEKLKRENQKSERFSLQ